MKASAQPAKAHPSVSLQNAVIRPDQTDIWQRALSGMDEKTRFLVDHWMPLLEKTYGYAPRLLCLWNRDALAAALPFVVVTSRFTGTRGVSLPFFDHCRAFNPDPGEHPSIYEAFKAYGKASGWDYFELRGAFQKLEQAESSLSFYNHIVDLSYGPEKVFANLVSSAQRAIRKAEKSELVIENSTDLSAIKAFYRLQCLTRRRHGLPPQPYRFFVNLHQQLIATGHGCVITAIYRNKPIASSVYLTQDDIAHYKYGASDNAYQHLRGNNLVMWSALEHFSKQGYREMDLGRNSLHNQGLRKYKLTWGPRERIVHYHRYSLKLDKTITMTDDVYGWHNTIFARLPIPLARMAGSLLYPHIA